VVSFRVIDVDLERKELPFEIWSNGLSITVLSAMLVFCYFLLPFPHRSQTDALDHNLSAENRVHD